MKLHPNYLIAGVSCIPYAVAALLMTKNGLLQGILCLLITLLISAASVYAQSRFLTTAAAKKSFVYPVAVAVIFLFCALVLRWNLLVPFYTVYQFSVAIPGALAVSKRNHETETLLPPLAVAAAASLLFALFGALFGLNG